MAEVKPFKCIDEQIQILESRGLIIPDQGQARVALTRNNYYRISGYTLTLRDKNTFYENVTFDDVMQLYNFDSELRSLLLFALEYVEICLRTNIGYHHGKKHGPLGYNNCDIFCDREHHNNFIKNFEKSLKENQRNEIFIRHHKEHCNGQFPIWVVVEVLSFGTLSKLFFIMDKNVRQEICKEKYHKIPAYYIESWLHCLSILRNICAHRARLYNRKFSMGPRFSPEDKALFNKLGFTSEQIGKSLFFYIFVLSKMIDDKVLWSSIVDQLEKCFEKYPFVKNSYMGFPEQWKEVLKKEELSKIVATDPIKPLLEA